MSLEFVLSTKDYKKLLNNGHLFVEEIANNHQTICKFDQYYTLKCRARIHTQDDSIIKRIGDHTYPAHIARVEAYTASTNMKRRSRNAQDATHSIGMHIFADLS